MPVDLSAGLEPTTKTPIDLSAGLSGPAAPSGIQDLIAGQDNTEGTYKIGGVAIPHSRVSEALSRGYDFDNNADRATFARNWRADPNTKRMDVPTKAGFQALQNDAARRGSSGLPGPIDTISREFAGDFQNLVDMVSGNAPTGDERYKNPNAGGASKAIAMTMELLSGEGEIAKLPTLALKLKAMMPALEVLEKYPRLQAALQTGMAGGAAMGAQDIATGKGAGQAAEDATLGTLMGPAAEYAINPALKAILRMPAKAAASLLDRYLPKSIDIAGENIPVTAEQVANGVPTGEGAANVPGKMAAQQQQGATNVIRNLGQRALQNILDRVNAGRVYAAAAPEGTLALAGQPGSDFTFSLDTTPVAEEQQGQLLHSAEPIPREATTTPATAGRTYSTETAPHAPYTQPAVQTAGTPGVTELHGPFETTTENGVTAQRRGTAYQHPATPAAEVDTRTEMEKLEGKPGPRPAVEGKQTVVGGGGTLTTKDPQEAQSWLYDLQQRIDSPDFKKLPEAEQNRMTAQHDQLQDRLGLYYNSPYHVRIAPVDTAAALGRTNSLGAAANESRAAVESISQTLDRESKGALNDFRKQERQALATLANPYADTAAKDQAQNALETARNGMDGVLQRYQGKINRQDYEAFKSAYADSYKLSEAHAHIEAMANGISLERSERTGLPRVFTGNAERLGQWLDAPVKFGKGTNGDALANLIGQNGVDDMMRLTTLMKDARGARSVQEVMHESAKELIKGVSGASFAGGVFGHAFGGHFATGAAVGGGLALTRNVTRQIFRTAATSPRVGQLVEYAATHEVDPKIYAPLIARTISEMLQPAPKPAEQGSEEQGKE